MNNLKINVVLVSPCYETFVLNTLGATLMMNDKCYFGQAQNYLWQGQYEQAIVLLNSLCQEKPEDLDCYLWLGLAYFLEKQEEIAQEIWMSCLLNSDSYHRTSEELSSLITNTINHHLVIKKPDFNIISKLFAVLNNLQENVDDHLSHKINKLIEITKKEALIFAFSENFSQAKEKYESILLISPNDDEVLYQLGMVYFELEDYEQAQMKVTDALTMNPNPSIYYEGLGLILEKIEQFHQAIEVYALAIEKDPKNPESYIKLANLLKQFSLSNEAQKLYKKALENEIKHFAVYMNYGNLLIDLEEYEKAVNLYKEAILLNKDYPDVYYNLAFALEKLHRLSEASLYYGKNAYYEGRIEKAFEYFEQYRLSEYADLDFYNELGNYYQAQRKQNELIPIAKEGIQRYPESIRQRLYLINAYQRKNEQDIALNLSDEAILFFQDEPKKSFIFEVFKQGILPIVYNTMNEIETFRKNYIRNLNLLIKNIAIEDESQKAFAMFILRNRNNYYLHYQNKNDLEIQVKYADFVRKAMRIFYSNWIEVTKYVPLNGIEKIRIGYLCHRSHGLGQLFLNWIKYRNPEKFETYFYDIGSVIDINTESFRLYSDYYHHIPGDFEKLLETIKENSLHILVFLDIGIEPELCCLSTLKLAPIQCSTWGHPITSGSSQIDYFLASDAMEPKNAQEHYSEKVVRLPNLGISIPAPEIPKTLKTRADFELQEEDILYVSCQMTAKYLPQHDYLFCEIAQQVPQCKILFSEAYESSEVNQKFRNRLTRKFDDYCLNINDFCLFKPRINPVDYRNLLCISDVFLDTIGWSGGLTSLDAIACHLPLVTLPGEFMRGRQSYGMLQIIGVTETIAKTEEDYIKIAVRLGLDAIWRQKIQDDLKANSSKLFNDLTCVQALETFYERIVRESIIKH